jgi:hypothetical protein
MPDQTSVNPVTESLGCWLSETEISSETTDAASPIHSEPEPTSPSPAQFAANQANSKLSSGPTSPGGKAISSRNNTRHGLTCQVASGALTVMPGESQAQYDSNLAAYHAEWKPTTATEIDLVQRICSHAWLRDRAQRFQDSRLHLGITEPNARKQFEAYSRYYTTHLRAYNKAFADLLRLKRFQMTQKKDEAMLERRAQDLEIRFESQKRKSEMHAARMESIRLKQEAQKQRNSRLKPAETALPATSQTA